MGHRGAFLQTLIFSVAAWLLPWAGRPGLRTASSSLESLNSYPSSPTPLLPLCACIFTTATPASTTSASQCSRPVLQASAPGSTGTQHPLPSQTQQATSFLMASLKSVTEEQTPWNCSARRKGREGLCPQTAGSVRFLSFRSFLSLSASVAFPFCTSYSKTLLLHLQPRTTDLTPRPHIRYSIPFIQTASASQLLALINSQNSWEPCPWSRLFPPLLLLLHTQSL